MLRCEQGPAGKQFSGKGCVELGRKALDTKEKETTQAATTVNMNTTAAATNTTSVSQKLAYQMLKFFERDKFFSSPFAGVTYLLRGTTACTGPWSLA